MTFLHEWEAKAITKWTALSKSSNVRKKGSDLEENKVVAFLTRQFFWNLIVRRIGRVVPNFIFSLFGAEMVITW